MAEYIDRKKIKKSYYFQTKGGVFPKSELFVKRDDIFDMQPADVVEREKIDKAIEEIKGQFYVLLKDKISIEESIEEIWWNNALAKTLEIIKRNIGE